MEVENGLNTVSKGHLAAGQLAEVWFEVLPYHCIDGDQAEYTGFSHTALRVVITLFSQRKTRQTHGHRYCHCPKQTRRLTETVCENVWVACEGRSYFNCGTHTQCLKKKKKSNKPLEAVLNRNLRTVEKCLAQCEAFFFFFLNYNCLKDDPANPNQGPQRAVV